jgi:ankyrin repeat protein
MKAKSVGHIDIVKYLIEHGTDIHLMNHNGNSLLDFFIDEKQRKLIEVIDPTLDLV